MFAFVLSSKTSIFSGDSQKGLVDDHFENFDSYLCTALDERFSISFYRLYII